MPKIPTVQADTALHSADITPNISSSDFGAKTGAALENLGSTITEGLYRLNDVHNEVQAHKAITDAQSELSDFQQELKTGPTNDGSQVDPSTGQPYPVGSPQTDPATGLPVGPPPPEKHAELMQQKIEEVREKYGGDFGPLGGGARRMFSANFDNYAKTQLLETKAHAVSRMNEQIGLNLQADLNNRANLAVNSDPLVRHTTEHETETFIDEYVKRGVLSPKQGFEMKQQFINETEVGTARLMLKQPLRPDGTDGASDLMKAIDNGEFNRVNAAQLERIRDMATTQHVANLRQKQENELHAITMNDKIQRDTSRKTTLGMIQLYSNNQLTPQAVQAAVQSGRLEPESALMLTKLASGGSGPPNKMAEFAMQDRMMQGEDAHDAIVKAVNGGHLAPEQGMKLLKENQQYGNLKNDQAYQAEVKYLRGLFGADSSGKLPAQPAALAEATYELNQHRMQNRKQSSADLHAFADEIYKRNSIVSQSDIVTRLPAPQFGGFDKAYLISGKASYEDFQKMGQETQKRFENKEITAAERNREMNNIGNWMKGLNISKPQPKQAEKK